jgi:hypothetical protein
MRTTIRLNDRLLDEARRFARRTRRTLTAVIDEALREKLGRARTRRPSASSPLPTFKGQGLQPGVDLDDTAALLDLMDGRRAAP